MTIYGTIKAAISVKQAAEHYGLKVSHNGMACCPFHNDRHPSLKLNEDYFFCFGCGAKGDVIDLVARLFNMSSYEAAQKLASDFGLDPKPPTVAAMVKPKRPYIRQFREDEMLCFRVLTNYLHLLEDWKVRYAPKTPEDALDDRFVEACQMHCYIEYMADVLTVGDLEERVALVDKLMQLNKDKLITEKQKKEGLNTDSIPIHSPNPLPLDEDEAAAPPPERTGSRKEAAYQIYRDLILENIEYDTLTQNPRIDREQLDEIVDILLETVCTNRKSIRVAGDDYPAELVKAKFLKLDSHHIEFVMDCLRDNTTKVRNIKQYLRAMLFNAPSTINSYYASLVAHDMAQPDWGRPPNN